MCDLTELYKEIVAKESINILGKTYYISNCTVATDGDILKLNACLLNDGSEITLFTEIRNFCTKTNN